MMMMIITIIIKHLLDKRMNETFKNLQLINILLIKYVNSYVKMQ